MRIEIEITEQEIKHLKLIRNYFGEHDITQFEHLAYSRLDELIKKIQLNMLRDGEEIQLVCDKCNWTEIGGEIFQCTKCLKVEDRLAK
jgi:hypothetical protein